MKRSDLTAAQRDALDEVVRQLFAGATLALAKPGEPTKYLCFRMKGEDLPEIPLSDLTRRSVAIQTGLFVSGETYHGLPGPGIEPSGRVWLGRGPLDEVLMTLEGLGAARQILDQKQVLDLRAAGGDLATAAFATETVDDPRHQEESARLKEGKVTNRVEPGVQSPSRNASYLVAAIGITRGVIAQCFASSEAQARGAVEAIATDCLGEDCYSVVIDRDASPGFWMEGSAEYIRTVVGAPAQLDHIGALSMLGYEVRPALRDASKFRWWKKTDSDVFSVPPLDCSTVAFDTAGLAWLDADRCEGLWVPRETSGIEADDVPVSGAFLNLVKILQSSRSRFIAESSLAEELGLAAPRDYLARCRDLFFTEFAQQCRSVGLSLNEITFSNLMDLEVDAEIRRTPYSDLPHLFVFNPWLHQGRGGIRRVEPELPRARQRA